MSTIGLYAGPPLCTTEGQALQEFLKKHTNETTKQETASRYKTARTRVIAQHRNGAGFPIDNLIRYFAGEFNDRNFNHGLRSMPSSFNVLEAFVQYEPEFSYFKIRPEQDYCISFSDFLDYATSPECPTDMNISTNAFDEGVIYSFNITNNLTDITFSTINGAEYGIGGFTIIRHGQELSVLLLAGEKIDTNKKTKELSSLKTQACSNRKKIVPTQDRKKEAVPLLGDPGFWQSIVLARFDSETRTQEVRYILKDIGDSFIVTTDDPSIYLDEKTGGVSDKNLGDLAKLSVELDQHKVLFELCKTCLSVASYLEFNVDNVRVERHPTSLAEDIQTGSCTTTQLKYLTSQDRVRYRNVSVLQSVLQSPPDNTFYHAPEFQKEVSGYWKRLLPQEIGEDKHGNAIHGRTWVKVESTWIQTQQQPVVVQAKRFSAGNTTKLNADKGYIYVMHNPAHGNDLFKVGLTRRNSDTRADELSGTGAPDKFLVAQEWEVTDCVSAEKWIHDILRDYRINPKREFFKISFQDLMKLISAGIKQFQG